ncbi:MAG: dihydropteroate synthase [Bacteriovoracaceae bacterium]
MNQTYRIMGVMNITPNSFSDGGEIDNSDTCYKRLVELHRQSHIIDVGAESTAPMNQAISEAEELSRFEHIFLPALKKFHADHGVFPLLSLDTYKVEVFQKMWEQLKSLGLKKIWWNDVSGIVDQDLVSYLGREVGVDYVFCHNRVPDRAKTSEHKYFADSSINIAQELKERFKLIRELFIKEGLHQRLHFDPCFGFAKTREQNHELIKVLPEILQQFHQDNWVLGISRKSFLAFLELEGDFVYREMLHFLLLSQWIKKFSSMKVTYRVHDPNILLLVDKTKHLS